MSTQTILALVILVAIVYMFFSPRFPNAVTATVGALAMGLAGFVPFKTMFNSYSSSSLVLMIGMMIVGGGIFQTGFAGWLGKKLVKVTGSSEKNIIFIAIISGWVMSSVCSGSATMMILLPIFCSISLVTKVSMSKIMLPFNTGVGFGSFMTLAGSGMCSATAAILIDYGYEGWTFFEPMKYGLPKAIVGTIVIMLIGYKLLPSTYIEPKMSSSENGGESLLPDVLSGKMKLSAMILLLTIVGMVLNLEICPMYICAAIGAMAMVLTGCMTQKQMFQSINWNAVFLLGGMTVVAKGIEASGLGQMLADGVLGIVGTNVSPVVMVIVIYMLTTLVTQFMSNNAAAALMTPIAIVVAQTIGCDPRALAAAALFGSSNPLSVMATPNMAIVQEYGNYSPMDIFKFGVLRTVYGVAVAAVFIPLGWL